MKMGRELVSGRWSWARGLAVVCLLAGCDTEGGPGLGADAEVADGLGADVEAVEEVVAAAPIVSASPRAVPRHDLFPDLSGDQLVWTSLWLDTGAPGASAETDCLACTYCTGCRADIVTRRLPDGPALTVYAGTRVLGAAKVGEGVVSFRDESGAVAVFDLETRAVRRFQAAGSGSSAAALPQRGALWDYAYDGARQRYMFRACPLGGSTCEGRLEASPRNEVSSNGTSLFELGRQQPFGATPDRLLWVSFEAQSKVMSWSYDGTVRTEASSAELMFRCPLVRDDGVIIAQAYPYASGCSSAACTLGFVRLEDGSAEPILPDAKATRFVAPTMAGDRLVWVDRRAAEYVVMSASPSGAMTRLSGDGAEIGTSSNLAASGRRVAWAERRQGRWRIVAKTL